MINGIKVIHVVAQARNRIIGSANTIPWQLPADMRRFREITEHGVVLMGRKTFESLPAMLRNRTHIVVGRTETNIPKATTGALAVFVTDLQEALLLAATTAKFNDQPAFFVIGGGEIYAQTLAQADVVELTVIRKEIVGDTVYPVLDENWSIEQLETHDPDDDGTGYGFYRATRKPGTVVNVAV